MDDEKLISLIQSFNCLYNKNNADFKDANKRERIWTTISMHMGQSVDLCQSRWRMLREKYAREKRSERISSVEENAARPKWLYMDQLAFLEPHIHPRNRRCFVQHTGDSSEDKKYVYKMDTSELEEAIEVVPVLLDEEQVSSASPCENQEAGRPTPAVDRQPRLDAAAADRRRGSEPAAVRPAESASMAALWQIINKLSSPQEENRDELFGRMVASELRGIADPHRKKKMKFKILTVLFDDSE